MNPDIQLLDCPHCGARQCDLDKITRKGIYAYSDAPADDIEPWIHVVCLECGASAPTVEAWNNRTEKETMKPGDDLMLVSKAEYAALLDLRATSKAYRKAKFSRKNFVSSRYNWEQAIVRLEDVIDKLSK